MKQQPDKIFHEKLSSHSINVPPMAWDRVEAGLNRKKRPMLWIAVAASVSLLLMTGYIFYVNRSANEKIAIEQSKQEKIPVEKPEKKTIEQLNGSHIAEGAMEKRGPAPTEVKPKKMAVRRGTDNKNLIISNEPKTSTLAANESQEKITIPDDLAPVDTVSKSYSQPKHLAYKPSAPEKNTIIITAAETNEYLIKNVTGEATSGAKKSSTLKKLLKKAADLKINQDPFGELRQKKNEILALNFRSEKQRGQKK
jgi:hypothetical protein